MDVVKRDGSLEKFDKNKLREAIEKACISARRNPEIAGQVANFVAAHMKGRKRISSRGIRLFAIHDLRMRHEPEIIKEFARKHPAKYKKVAEKPKRVVKPAKKPAKKPNKKTVKKPKKPAKKPKKKPRKKKA